MLTNVYLPTEDGTTELDLVCITLHGLYVIESKNYSGWIFGSEHDKNWTSMIHQSKFHFFNPIWQNKKHVNYLQQVLPNADIHSLIAFSERCEFKKLTVGENIVIKRHQLKKTILKETTLALYSEAKILQIYEQLRGYSLQSETVKQKHIQALRKKNH